MVASGGTSETVAIIGGGFSGTLLALKLARAGLTPVLIEPRSLSGPGLAYGAAKPWHRLNVPAQRMELGLSPSFTEWLSNYRVETAGAVKEAGTLEQAFVPRFLFGRYLSELLEKAVNAGRVVVRRGRTVRLEHVGQGHVVLALEDRRTVTSSKVVLATGNLPPTPLPVKSIDGRLLIDVPRYFGDPWSREAVTDLDEQAAVLLIGTGLTMADTVFTLKHQGHRGPIYVLSRHGLLPLAHKAGGQWAASYDKLAGLSPLAILRLLRADARTAHLSGVPWQRVLDAVRPAAARIWTSWTNAQRSQFLRHLRVYWDVHRHRLPPTLAWSLKDLTAGGTLVPLAGRLRSFAERDDAIRIAYARRGRREIRNLKIARVINCTGPGSNFAHTVEPLFAGLRDDGLIQPDALGLGLVTQDASVIGQDGAVSPALFAIGSLTRPAWWEITAVPEIAAQINRLVALLTEDQGLRSDMLQDFVDLGAGI